MSQLLTAIPTDLAADGARLARSLEELGQIGRLPSGAVRRLAFSEEDQAARSLVGRWMEEAGMAVRIDAAGNLIGRYDGLNPDAPAIATGSHIDTVPEGGLYDGALGVLGGIEVVRVLAEQQLRLQHPIEVIAFADEESTMVGCKSMVGHGSDDPDSYTTALGVPEQPEQLNDEQQEQPEEEEQQEHQEQSKAVSISIPKSVLALHKIADPDSTRYALGQTHITNQAGTACGVVTDGKRLVTLYWREQVPDDHDPIKMAYDSAKTLHKQVPKDKSITLRCGEDMSLTATCPNGANIVVEKAEGRFPKWQDCVPPDDEQEASVKLDLDLFIGMLNAIKEHVVDDCGNHIAEFQIVRLGAEKAVKVKAHGENGRSAVAALMPIC
ncbi:MAG: M20/M25/M40 family metallo-hydrolase [Halomonas sp.]